MGRRLILDTNILIDYERNAIDRMVLKDDDLAVAAITIAEYRVGIELTDSARDVAHRSQALKEIQTVVKVLDYTAATAEHHARLIAYVKSVGKPRQSHDLIIAAHAAETGRTVFSLDAKARFADLPDVLADQPT